MTGDTAAELGLLGLGTMGAALALNIAGKGVHVAVTNRNSDVTKAFIDSAGDLADRLTPAEDSGAFVAALRTPRVVILMVTAGPAVDAVIESLLPHLARGDMLIDGGNSDFNDTRRRERDLALKGIHFAGMGVSGGEEGARNGPSIMIGGSDDAWSRIRPLIDAIAASYQGDPCADRLGPDGAGHFVKTVHNGIEYADMELIAETYGLLRYGQNRSPAEIADLFGGWNAGPLHSYLVEITEQVLRATDPDTGAPMVDVILDTAGQKGTGRWSVIEALKLGQSASTIEAAVGARGWSAAKTARETGAGIFPHKMACHPILDGDFELALLAARMISYAQGFSLLAAASDEFSWDLDLPRVAEIWRAGCIIRSSLLDDIASALRDGPPEGLLIFAPRLADRLREGLPALRRVTAAAISAGLPVPAFSAAIAYFDTMRTARGTTDLIQAQRDFFGAHGFDRIDGTTGQHGPWHS